MVQAETLLRATIWCLGLYPAHSRLADTGIAHGAYSEPFFFKVVRVPTIVVLSEYFGACSAAEVLLEGAVLKGNFLYLIYSMSNGWLACMRLVLLRHACPVHAAAAVAWLACLNKNDGTLMV